ncbi:MAG: sigma-70 family RNA polymerase sigma factor [Gemmatimonadota bacterium]|nr:sigma-70 family RNA polymerase sigma factor [Gemmatimonadota bacterium]
MELDAVAAEQSEDPPTGWAPRGAVTHVLRSAGTEALADTGIFSLVYDELRRIARRQLAREGIGHTLETTALVHEAYLRLVDQSRARFADRAHFFAVAAQMMRRVLIDHARRFRASKRGGDLKRVDLDRAEIPLEDRADTLVALDDALTRLAAMSPRLAQVVECRYFGGMTEEETAAALGVTDRTVRRDWVKAKGWLYAEITAV